jgi:phospholipase/carboxylesterase
MNLSITTSLHHVLIPPRSGGSGPHPTLLMLHGRGADENDLLGLADSLDPRLLIISAQAPFRFPYGGHTWYDILEVGTPEPRQFTESYNRLTQFLSDIKRSYPIDEKRLFLLGFSMGTVMSYALALTKPDDIAGVVAHSGYIPEGTHLTFAWDKIGNTGFFVAHGTMDPVIPVAFARRAREVLTEAKAELTYREYPIAHHVSERSLADLAAWLEHRLAVNGLKK